jgi:hypothetical protein
MPPLFHISKKIEGKNELGEFIEYHLKEKPRTKVVIQQMPIKRRWIIYTITPKRVFSWDAAIFYEKEKEKAITYVENQIVWWGPGSL